MGLPLLLSLLIAGGLTAISLLPQIDPMIVVFQARWLDAAQVDGVNDGLRYLLVEEIDQPVARFVLSNVIVFPLLLLLLPRLRR